ncbi:2'-5' RNA ligase [Flavobacterium arsenatis]|uniref:2'-5' RNA ligase n=1 Tax=Flavobacterium arsenatis TaxID=1484332 RepID=A0ABU1TP92_9FLAO|nr:2'-5' RNA ligase family protein [Flavobacterium arsenatis]MDR6967721.1 2'-5' RNA ligase [Flavobacterium arsenatis]
MNISKKGQILLFPPPELKDYLVVISAPIEIHNEIKKINDKLHKIIASKEKGRFKAHITLFNSAWEQDNHLLERLKKVISDANSFPVLINGVDIFSNGTKKKTVYLKIENPKPIQKLYEAFRTELKIKKEFTPHLTIEKNLPIADFEKIQNDLSSFNHQCEWVCDRITVLKFNKKTNSYKLVEEILLKNSEA